MLRGVRVEYGWGGANWAGKEGKEGDGRSFIALCCGLKLAVWDPSVVLRG